MTWRRQDWLYGAGVLVVVCILGPLVPSAEHRYESARVIAQPPTPKWYYLSTPNHASMLLCASPHVLAEFTKIAAHNDTYGLMQLIASGQAMEVPDGTEVLMLGPGFGASEVRIRSGALAGRSGYVASEFVHER